MIDITEGSKHINLTKPETRHVKSGIFVIFFYFCEKVCLSQKPESYQKPFLVQKLNHIITSIEKKISSKKDPLFCNTHLKRTCF
jgi:hypothetical protein